MEEASRAGCLLEEKLGIRDFKMITEDVIEIYDSAASVNEIATVLVREQVMFLGIGRKQKSLEDYFFHVITEDE